MHETPPSEDAAGGYYDCSRRIRRLMQWVDEKRIIGYEKRNEMSLDESDVSGAGSHLYKELTSEVGVRHSVYTNASKIA
jgi:hypothetical protein